MTSTKRLRVYIKYIVITLLSGKEPAYKAGDAGSILGSGRARIFLEKEMATSSSVLVWRIPWTEATVYGVTKSWIQLSDYNHHQGREYRVGCIL